MTFKPWPPTSSSTWRLTHLWADGTLDHTSPLPASRWVSPFPQPHALLVAPAPAGCGKLTGVSNPITVRAMGSRFGSWMTDTMAPSTDSRVSDTVPLGLAAWGCPEVLEVSTP